MARDVYELIPYDGTNFKFNVVSADYGPLHLHKEPEVVLMLYGSCIAECMGQERHFNTGDFFIFNPMKSHQVISDSVDRRIILLNLQLSPDFFTGFFPDFSNIEFEFEKINRENLGQEKYDRLLKLFLDMATVYFEQKPFYGLQTASMICSFFYELLSSVSYHLVTPEEIQAAAQKTMRFKELLDYINEHYMEPLYLTDLAERGAISMSRLSHAFKETFGLPFQEYLAKVRCQKASELLKDTDLKLIDICMECGFSDPKYFNRDFRKYYHLTPKEYRSRIHERKALAQERGYVYGTFLSAMPASTDTRQNLFGDHTTFFGPEDALAVLDYLKEEDHMLKGE